MVSLLACTSLACIDIACLGWSGDQSALLLLRRLPLPGTPRLH